MDNKLKIIECLMKHLSMDDIFCYFSFITGYQPDTRNTFESLRNANNLLNRLAEVLEADLVLAINTSRRRFGTTVNAQLLIDLEEINNNINREKIDNNITHE